MNIRNITALISSGVGLITLTVAVVHYVPLRPEFERRLDNILIDLKETELRRREENICEIKSHAGVNYRLCMMQFERIREERELMR